MGIAPIDRFLAEIWTTFPEVRARMESHDEVMTTSRMEEFAKATTEAFANGDIESARAYLSFMSKRAEEGTPVEHEFIDAYYVENLFWPHGTTAARLGWRHVPDNLKKLFVDFHSRSPL